jgi:toxin YoeB
VSPITFSDNAWDDYTAMVTQGDRRALGKITKLIKDIARTPEDGLGKPEPLRGEFSGYWSRRITDKDRLIYRTSGDDIQIVQCRGHYGDH